MLLTSLMSVMVLKVVRDTRQLLLLEAKSLGQHKAKFRTCKVTLLKFEYRPPTGKIGYIERSAEFLAGTSIMFISSSPRTSPLPPPSLVLWSNARPIQSFILFF